MTVLLHLPPDLEARLTDAAAQEGVDPEELILQTLLNRFHADDEARLRQQIADWIAPEDWQRYQELVRARARGGWTKAEGAEFFALNERVERRHAERLQRVLDFAQKTGRTFAEAMEELGLRFPLKDADVG